MILPNVKSDEIEAVLNEKRQATRNKYHQTYTRLDNQHDRCCTISLYAFIISVLSLISTAYTHNEIFLSTQASWFNQLDYCHLIARISMMIFILSVISTIVSGITALVDTHKIEDIYYKITKEWEKWFSDISYYDAYIILKGDNLYEALPIWLKQLKRLHNLPVNDSRYTYQYASHGSYGISINILINNHHYKTMDIDCDNAEEFAKASNLDFTYFDDRWANLKTLLQKE